MAEARKAVRRVVSVSQTAFSALPFGTVERDVAKSDQSFSKV